MSGAPAPGQMKRIQRLLLHYPYESSLRLLSSLWTTLSCLVVHQGKEGCLQNSKTFCSQLFKNGSRAPSAVWLLNSTSTGLINGPQSSSVWKTWGLKKKEKVLFLPEAADSHSCSIMHPPEQVGTNRRGEAAITQNNGLQMGWNSQQCMKWEEGETRGAEVEALMHRTDEAAWFSGEIMGETWRLRVRLYEAGD